MTYLACLHAANFVLLPLKEEEGEEEEEEEASWKCKHSLFFPPLREHRLSTLCQMHVTEEAKSSDGV